MTKILSPLVVVAYRHAEAEATGDIETVLATMEGEPTYEFFPLGRGFRGMANTRRYYEHFFSDVDKRTLSFEMTWEWIGEGGLLQEYVIAMQHAGDPEPTRHHVMSLMVFGERGLAGERLYSDEKFFRTLLRPMWNELEPIP